MALNRRFPKENGWLSASERLALCVGFGGSISSQYSTIFGMIGKKVGMEPTDTSEQQAARETRQFERQEKSTERTENEKKEVKTNITKGRVFLAEEEVNGNNVKIYFDAESVKGNQNKFETLVGYDDDDIKSYRTVIGFLKVENELYCMTKELNTGAITPPIKVKKGTKVYDMYKKILKYVNE